MDIASDFSPNWRRITMPNRHELTGIGVFRIMEQMMTTLWA